MITKRFFLVKTVGGTAFHVFTPEDINMFQLHGLTIHPLWTLSTGGEVVYTTGCQTAQLD